LCIGGFVITIIVFIIHKFMMTKKKPLKNPFITNYFNAPAFHVFRDYQMKEISKIRSSDPYMLEAFQSFKESFSSNIQTEDIQRKMIKIQESKKEKPGWFDKINRTISDNIDSFQTTIRSWIVQTYLSKQNTIRTVAPIAMENPTIV